MSLATMTVLSRRNPRPSGRKILFLCRLFSALFVCLQGILVFATEDALYDVDLGSVKLLNPSLGQWLTVPSTGNSLERATRLRILGLSRLHNLSRMCHAARLKLNIQKTRERQKGKVHVCLHWNESMALGECNGTSWKLMDKSWEAMVSPYGTTFLDVKIDSDSHEMVFTAEAEFQPHQVVFLLLGLVLLSLAPAMAACVPLYYSSAMALSIIAVILIILYQTTKLLPVGRKRAMNMLIFGSLVGLTSVIVSYFETALTNFGAMLGMEKGGILSPVVIFAVIFVFIVGAGLGYWAVRKFVLGPDGKPNAATANFVSASIRAIAFGMLLLSSSDHVFRELAIGFGAIIMMFSQWGWVLPLTSRQLRRQKPPPLLQGDQRVLSDDNPVSPATPSTKLDFATPKAQSKRRLLASPSSATPPAGTFLSSFYKTPVERPMTEDEFEESGVEHTAKGLAELVTDPGFAEWAEANAYRIRADPVNGEDNPRRDISSKDVYNRNAGKGGGDYPLSEEESGGESARKSN